MANDDYPWDPPVAGTEAEALVGALDRLRTTFRWKADDLDAAGLQTRIPSSPLTLGSLLKHLSRAEDEIFTVKLSGAPRSAPWDTAPWDADPDWDFTSAADDTPDQLYALWDSTIAPGGGSRAGRPSSTTRIRSSVPVAASAAAIPASPPPTTSVSTWACRCSHRPRGAPQRAGDGGQGGTGQVPFDDGLAHSDREGLGHGTAS